MAHTKIVLGILVLIAAVYAIAAWSSGEADVPQSHALRPAAFDVSPPASTSPVQSQAHRVPLAGEEGRDTTLPNAAHGHLDSAQKSGLRALVSQRLAACRARSRAAIEAPGNGPDQSKNADDLKEEVTAAIEVAKYEHAAVQLERDAYRVVDAGSPVDLPAGHLSTVKFSEAATLDGRAVDIVFPIDMGDPRMAAMVQRRRELSRAVGALKQADLNRLVADFNKLSVNERRRLGRRASTVDTRVIAVMVRPDLELVEKQRLVEKIKRDRLDPRVIVDQGSFLMRVRTGLR